MHSGLFTLFFWGGYSTFLNFWKGDLEFKEGRKSWARQGTLIAPSSPTHCTPVLLRPDPSCLLGFLCGEPLFSAPLGPEVQRPRSCLPATVSCRISSGKDLLTCPSPLTQVITSNLFPLARQPGRDCKQAGGTSGPARGEASRQRRVGACSEREHKVAVAGQWPGRP